VKSGEGSGEDASSLAWISAYACAKLEPASKLTNSWTLCFSGKEIFQTKTFVTFRVTGSPRIIDSIIHYGSKLLSNFILTYGNNSFATTNVATRGGNTRARHGLYLVVRVMVITRSIDLFDVFL